MLGVDERTLRFHAAGPPRWSEGSRLERAVPKTGASEGMIGVRAFVRMMPGEGPREQSSSRENRVQVEEHPKGLGAVRETPPRGQSFAGRAPNPCGSGVDRVTSTRPRGTIPSAESTAHHRLAAALLDRRSTFRIPEAVAKIGFVRRPLMVENSRWIAL